MDSAEDAFKASNKDPLDDLKVDTATNSRNNLLLSLESLKEMVHKVNHKIGKVKQHDAGAVVPPLSRSAKMI